MKYVTSPPSSSGPNGASVCAPATLPAASSAAAMVAWKLAEGSHGIHYASRWDKKSGRRERDRTSDPFHVKVVLYH